MARKALYISRFEASKCLGVSPQTVDRVCTQNGIQRFNLTGHKRYFYRRDVIERLVTMSGMGALIESRTAQADGSAVSL